MKYILLGAALLTFAACSDNAGTSKSSETKTETTEKKKAVNAAIKNGITIKESGLTVSKAMLLTADGTEIDDANTVGIGEDILCRFFISGWKDEGGKVKIGASQTIATEDGTVILNEDDLFSSMESASAEDAGIITLKATITELKKSIKDFVVTFRIWDKLSNSEMSGEYTFHLK